MASFRSHFAWGIVLGVAAVTGTIVLALSQVSSFLVALFLAVVTGALMPDMDSDSSIPFHVTFASLALIAGILAFFYAFKTTPNDYRAIALWVVGAIFLVWAVIGSIFKHFTRHRGMAHSIPAALLVGLIIFLLAGKYGFSEWEAFLLSIALGAGYVGHLVLDELYAGTNFHGRPFIPNKAFGSALKLFSRDKSTNALLYGALAVLLFANWAELLRLTNAFLELAGK